LEVEFMDKISPFPDEADIHAYVDGRLDSAGRRYVEAWLERHPEQAAEVLGWRRDAQQLRTALGDAAAPANLSAVEPAAIRVRRRRRTGKRLALAATLVLAVAIGSLVGWQIRPVLAPAGMAPMADAIQAYRMFAMDADASLDIRHQQPGDIRLWLNRHLPQPTNVPDLGTAGFHPVGGRLVATNSGPAAVVVYRN